MPNLRFSARLKIGSEPLIDPDLLPRTKRHKISKVLQPIFSLKFQKLKQPCGLIRESVCPGNANPVGKLLDLQKNCGNAPPLIFHLDSPSLQLTHPPLSTNLQMLSTF